MIRETVLYYNPNKAAHAVKLKSIFVRMGIRIKNVTPDQVHETVGYLAGMPGFEISEKTYIFTLNSTRQMSLQKRWLSKRMLTAQ